MMVIIDYKMGNIGSIQNMLKRIGVKVVVSSDACEIMKAGKIILPGVGAFDEGMKNLNELGLTELLIKRIKEEGVPILGICLGMQLFSEKSEEGVSKGLGLVEAVTVKFRMNQGLKVPHMGWNTVSPVKENPLYSNLNNNRFYFVHSYHVACRNREDVLSETHYGYDFVSSLQHKNIYGVQFHPEKSHKFGMQLLRNFSELC